MFPGHLYRPAGEKHVYLSIQDEDSGRVDVEDFMMDDHQETNNRIAELLSSKGKLNKNTVQEIDSKLKRHIFIEETVLFPELPPEMYNDTEYLEKEHGKVFRILDSIACQKDEGKIQNH